MNQSRCHRRGLSRVVAALLLSGLIAVLSPIVIRPSVAFAQSGPIRNVKVDGFLPTPFSKHYLALEPSQRDATVVLTMTFDPQDIDQTQGGVNFLVLNEDGMRRFLAGAELQDLDIASGSPLQFGGAGNVLQAAFTASGSGNYTVIVFNNAPLDVTYSLTAQGGVLIDESGQTRPPVATTTDSAASTAVTEVVTPTAAVSVATPAPAATTVQTGTQTSTAAESNLIAQNVRARRVSGELTGPTQKHYLSLEPGSRDADVSLVMNYDPQDKEELVGKINFWVLDEDGVRRMVRGDNPRDLNLATGFPSPYSANRNELSAAFKAAGEGAYTVVMYNISDLVATYALRAESALLVDLYGQTNESKAASVELAAIQAAESATGDSTPAVAATETGASPTAGSTAGGAAAAATTVGATVAATEPATATTTVISTGTASTMGVNQLAGTLDRPYEHQYLGLVPDVVDGVVTLSMDFEPQDSQALAENINFWVINEDGLRRVASGARPEDVNIATGGKIEFGPSRGTLRAVFNTSGRGQYTVIVYNNSEVPASYLLTAEEALLEDESGTTIVPGSLP